MSAQAPPEPQAKKRSWRRMLAYGAGGGASVIVIAGAIVLGPAGPSLAATLANGQDVWRLGKLRVEGVSGNGLGDLTVRRATLSDEQGVWAVGEDLRIAWEPLKLILGDVTLQHTTAEKLTILRRPTLSPPKDSGPVTIDTDVASIKIAQIQLADGVSGPAALFSFEGGAASQHGALSILRVDLKRLDKPLDALTIDYARAPNIKLEAHLIGRPGGALAALIEAPQADIEAVAKGSGASNDQGAIVLDATISGKDAAHTDLAWTKADWRLSAEAHLDALPVLSDLSARFGPLVTLTASGGALKPAGAPFHAVLAARELSGEARGKLDDELKVIGAAPFTLNAARLGALLPELDLEAGGGRFEGAAEFENDRTRISGRAALDKWRRNGFSFSAEGPIEILASPKQVAFEADLAGENLVAPLDELTRLLATPRFTAKGKYDRAESALTFERLAATGPDFVARGAGKVGEGGLADTLFKGEWRAPHLGAAIPDLSGSAQGTWALSSVKGGLALNVDGDGRGVSGRSPAAALLGGAPKLEAKLSFLGKLSRLDVARLNGRALRLGASGVLSGAPTSIRLEASARGPIDIGGARLSGALDATGAVTGSLDAPHTHVEAQLGALDMAGVSLQNAKVSLDLAPEQKGQGGRVTLTALLMEKPLVAEARLALKENYIAFENLSAKVAQIEAHGRAAFGKNGPEADVRLAGAIDGLVPQSVGKIQGAAIVSSPKPGHTNLLLDADIKLARFGPKVAADAVSMHVAGPLEAMDARYSIQGWAADDPFRLAGDGMAGFGKRGFVLNLNAKGVYAGKPLETRIPLSARFDGPLLEASAGLDIAGGKADITWRGEYDRLNATGQFQNAPLDILTAFMDQPIAGTIDGQIKLSGAKKSLDGDLDFTLTDARLARRSRDSVDATIKATLGGGTLRGKIDAKSGQGLVASIEGQAPVIAEAAPFRLAAANGGQGQAHWSVDGPVEGLWALFGPLDQSLTGKINGAGDAQFGKGGISGEGALTIADGGFEDKQSGVKLRQIAAKLSFDQKGMRLDAFNATDGREGVISGSGRLDGPDDGRLELTIANMRLLDRADAKAIGGGKIEVVWKQGGAVLSGDIALTEAQMLAIGSNAAASVPVIDVVEINRPGPPPRITGPASAIPVKFDVAVHAPGRIFTRTRGLDAEWSLDMRMRGDAQAPILLGSANLVRGQFSLAGRRFELETGEIKFSGAPEDAEVNLTAVADTPDLSVRVLVTGRADDPEIALSSTPSLPEDEILPQLLFGRSTRELSGLEAAQLAASLATLAGQSAFDIAGAARSAVDLDRLEFRQENGGFLVSGGKYLTRDVYLEVARGSLGETSTSVEWQVKPRLFVISSFGAAGDQKVSLRWKRDY